MSLSENFSRNIGNIALVIEKNMPKILQIVGTVAATGGCVWACKQTIKAKDILEEHHEILEELEASRDESENSENDLYSEETFEKDKKALYIQTGTRIAKTYAGPVVLFVGGIVALNASPMLLQERLTTMTASYVTLKTVFDKYRKRVIEDHGEETDYDYLHGLKSVQREFVDENGKKKKEKVKEVIDEDLYLTMSRFFDEDNLNFTRGCNDLNILFLINIQEEMNRLLKAQGHLFLNEVYDRLGFKRTKYGAKYGWIWDGETTVDFGFLNSDNAATRRFKNDLEEEALLLCFNVDGPIIDLI